MSPKFQIGDYIHMHSAPASWSETTILKIININNNHYKVLQAGSIKLITIPEISTYSIQFNLILYFEHEDAYITLNDDLKNKLLKQLVFS